MKKLLAIPLLFITSTLFAEANITINPRTLLRSTNTWTAAQNFSSATFTTIKVDNCDGCGTGGGGGGGSGAALFNGVNQTISVSTFGFPGASITSSQGFSTVTWNPAINSTYTQALVHDSTAQVKIHNINLTTGTAFSTFSGFLSTAGTTAETFKTWFASHSLYDVALATTINQNKADINNSTNTYQSFDNIRASTFAVQIDSISTAIGGIAPSTRAAVSQLSVSISTTQDVIKSTAAGLSTIGTINTADNPVDWSRLKNVPAGFADGTDDGGGGGITTDQANALILSTFNALTATAAYTTNQFTAAFSSIGALGASTQAIQSFFTGFMSTSDARGNTFVNFNTTGDVRLQNVQVATGTLAVTFSGFLSTTSQRLQDVQVSTGTLASTFSGFLTTGDVRLQNVQVSTGTLASTFSTFITTANDVMRSTMSELADNTNTINTATNLVSWNSLKDVPAGFADGTDDGAGGSGITAVDVFDGTSHFATSNTITVRTPYGPASVAGTNALITTVTVMGSTNPYRMVPISAGSWYACTQSSASRANGGFVLTSTPTAWDRFGYAYHLFEAPITTISAVCADVTMPQEWDGSTVAFSLVWHSTGLSGRTIDNLIGWSIGAIGFSSGTSIYNNLTSSVTVWSAFSGTNTHIMTEQSAGYGIAGNSLPGLPVKFVLMAGGGGFNGLPRMTHVNIWWRESKFDGRLR